MTASQAEQQRVTELYAEVELFYARHFQLLDGGDTQAWAQTFTPDGAFFPPTLSEPVRGRAALATGAAKAHAGFEEQGVQRRHWHGMVDVRQREDDSVFVRCYALIFVTPAGGEPRLHMTCVCEDILVHTDEGLQVAERRVHRDDQPR
ncbi:nuclear transport factor 2 family protein [Streptomyces rimosus]|uniref:nuclear transport factor 2 family protein n=1 Tax=Streptomyces rimosus TaxID=1927 RepID=UPI0004C281EE|nr:nuclear transport factor 2 family protein [Streptomyces rimosus]